MKIERARIPVVMATSSAFGGAVAIGLLLLRPGGWLGDLMAGAALLLLVGGAALIAALVRAEDGWEDADGFHSQVVPPVPHRPRPRERSMPSAPAADDSHFPPTLTYL